MRRGGGAFEFALTPAANSALDATRLVIGETLGNDNGENLRRIAELNERASCRCGPAVGCGRACGGVAALYGLPKAIPANSRGLPMPCPPHTALCLGPLIELIFFYMYNKPCSGVTVRIVV